MTKYKYITIWTSYDKVEQKMTELSQEGYEYDNCYFVIVRMKKQILSQKSTSSSMIKTSRL